MEQLFCKKVDRKKYWAFYLIYLDNASTSFPKPECMLQGMEYYLKNIGVNPYRGSNLQTRTANLMIHGLRRLLGKCLGIEQFQHLSFTYNATYAINILLKGFLKQGDHVIISSYDHNAVLRPLHALRMKKIIDYDVWTCDHSGLFAISSLEKLVRPTTRLLFMSTHSNVLGMPLPLAEISCWVRQKKLFWGLDCTQSLGHLTLELDELGVDMAAGTGHKGLLGPPGIGFLYIKNPDLIDALIQGGGGYISSALEHPDIAPAKYEAGTINYLAIAGLFKSLEWLSVQDSSSLSSLFLSLKEELSHIKGIKIYGHLEMSTQLPLLAFNLASLLPSQVEHYLEQQGIIVRSGLHCAPLIHQALGTYPHGAVRVSLSLFNHQDHISSLINHLRSLAV